MLANAAMRQALINRGLTEGLDCDTVEAQAKVNRPAAVTCSACEEPLRVDKGLELWYSST